MSDAKLPIVKNVRDLGVLVDNRLTFRDHINSIISGGNVKTMQKSYGDASYARMLKI